MRRPPESGFSMTYRHLHKARRGLWIEASPDDPMRIGIFSDVHANIEAINAVMEAFRAERIDKYVCLGDIVGYGATQRVLRHRAQGRGVHHPRQPRRRGRRADGLLATTTTPRARRSTSTPAS